MSASSTTTNKTNSASSNLRLQLTHLLDPSLSNNTDDGKDVIAGLTQNTKSLSPRYFYDDRGSQLFEQICELPEYYPTRTEASILQTHAAEIAQLTGQCELVELGSGSSTKTRLLLDAYTQLANSVQYIPIDVSGGILKDSAQQLLQDYPNLNIHGLVATYQQALANLEPTKLPGRMVFFLGSSLGNFTPQMCHRFFQQLTAALQRGEYFLLGIDLQKPKPIIEAAYNDSQGVTAAFNLNMLNHLNWRFQGNFDLDLFTHKAIYNQSECQIEMYLHSKSTHTVRLESLDLTVEFTEGEKILTEISRKFNLEEMQSDLEKQGLETLKVWTDPQQWFGMLLCQKA